MGGESRIRGPPGTASDEKTRSCRIFDEERWGLAKAQKVGFPQLRLWGQARSARGRLIEHEGRDARGPYMGWGVRV
jgi:hypothetical protein